MHAITATGDVRVCLSIIVNITPFDAHIMSKKLKEPRNPSIMTALHALEDGLLELALDLLARVVLAGLAVEAEEGAQIELRLLKKLNLSYVDLFHVSSASKTTNKKPHTFWRG
jgi:hypothetical protein